ncbi:MAG: moaD [Caulobacter sp.]|nr:moaD [Caulobacter sp.]
MAKVLLFGRFADVAGWREKTIEAATLADLRTALSADPHLAEALAGPSVQVAVDKALVRADIALTAASEVAFLPPMSGG